MTARAKRHETEVTSQQFGAIAMHETSRHANLAVLLFLAASWPSAATAQLSQNPCELPPPILAHIVLDTGRSQDMLPRYTPTDIVHVMNCGGPEDYHLTLGGIACCCLYSQTCDDPAPIDPSRAENCRDQHGFCTPDSGVRLNNCVVPPSGTQAMVTLRMTFADLGIGHSWLYLGITNATHTDEQSWTWTQTTAGSFTIDRSIIVTRGVTYWVQATLLDVATTQPPEGVFEIGETENYSFVVSPVSPGVERVSLYSDEQDPMVLDYRDCAIGSFPPPGGG